MFSGRPVSLNHRQNWANHQGENSVYFSSDPRTCKPTDILQFQFIAYSFYSAIYSGFVEIANIKSYQQHRLKYIEKGKCKGSSFKNAVKKADDFLLDPIVIIITIRCFSYDRVV